MSRPKRQQPEHDLQIQVVEFLTRALPADAVFFHVPNGGKRTKAEAGRFKAMGVKAGVPDLVVFWKYTWGSPGLTKVIWLELKAPGTAHRPSATTDEQDTMQAALRDCGHAVYVVDNLDDIEAALRQCGIPLRATLGRPAA